MEKGLDTECLLWKTNPRIEREKPPKCQPESSAQAVLPALSLPPKCGDFEGKNLISGKFSPGS